MRVAEVARRAGVGAHAVRFYVRAGLLRAERDPSNNYKQFGEAHVLRLRFIKGAQSLGFSLAEIRGLLARMDSGECTCQAMHLQLADKILGLRRQIEELQGWHAYMQRVYDDWRAGTDGPHDLGKLCRFLEQQAAEEPRSAAPEPGPSEAPDEGARVRVAPPPGGRREPKPKAGFRADGRRRVTGGRATEGLELFDLLNREWRSLA